MPDDLLTRLWVSRPQFPQTQPSHHPSGNNSRSSNPLGFVEQVTEVDSSPLGIPLQPIYDPQLISPEPYGIDNPSIPPSRQTAHRSQNNPSESNVLKLAQMNSLPLDTELSFIGFSSGFNPGRDSTLLIFYPKIS